MTGGEPERRRSLRLQGYDYAQAGACFVTICTQGRECLFGEIMDGKMLSNDAGRMVNEEWHALPQRFPTIELDAFVVMPNHVHGIIVIAPSGNNPAPVGAGLVPAPGLVPALGRVPARNGAITRVAPTLGDMVGAFKSRVTVKYVHGVKSNGWLSFHGRVWQRNYYEHIIRDEASLHRIREYIANNPLQWALDRENPANVGTGPLVCPDTGQPQGVAPTRRETT